MENLLCRVCLADTGEFQTVFTSVKIENTNTTMHLSEMICSFAHIQITLGDGLPEQICQTCADETVRMYFFKVRCEKSDNILRQKLIENSNKSIIDIETKPLLAKNILDELEQGFSNYDSISDDNNEDKLDLFYESIKVDKPEKIKSFECATCLKKFTREDLLLRHKIAHAMKMQDFEDKQDESENDDTEQEITKVDGTVPIDEADSNTINSKTKDFLTDLKCILCNIIVENDNLLDKHLHKEHLNVVNGEKGAYLECKLCPVEIKDIRYFIKHIKRKHRRSKGNRKYSCPHCFMEYKYKGNLRNHMRYHKGKEFIKNNSDTEEKEYSCDHCNKIFKDKKDIRNHLCKIMASKRIGGTKKPHICEICYKTFNQISNLKDHLRTHNGEKPFLCPTCGKGFNQLGNLRQHQVRHSGVKSHVCTTCNHGFASKGELHAHLRKHTGARPFVCDACGNGFTTSSSLTKHKRIHSGEKPYECDYCKMKFSRSGILSRHRRIHTGEKPYVCEICEKAFSQSNDLNSHMRIHTGEKPFKCNECGQHFRQSSALRTHKKVHLEPKPVKPPRQAVAIKREVFVEDEENLFENAAI